MNYLLIFISKYFHKLFEYSIKYNIYNEINITSEYKKLYIQLIHKSILMKQFDNYLIINDNGK